MYVFLPGLLLGTLLNIIIIRLPREKRLLGWPHCTRTGERLALWQMIPVLGWLFQRGHARNGQWINWIYPFVELLTATVLTLLYTRYSFSPLFFYLSFVCIVLIVTGAIDWTHRFIYTFVILGAAVLALLAHLVAPDTMPGMDGLDALIGMIAAGIAFMLLYLLANIMFPGKSVPFGMGDVFLAVFIGAAVGMHRLAPTLVYGMLMAGVVAGGIVIGKYALRRRDMPEYMPYGTYLCLGAIVYLLVNGW